MISYINLCQQPILQTAKQRNIAPLQELLEKESLKLEKVKAEYVRAQVGAIAYCTI